MSNCLSYRLQSNATEMDSASSKIIKVINKDVYLKFAIFHHKPRKELFDVLTKPIAFKLPQLLKSQAQFASLVLPLETK